MTVKEVFKKFAKDIEAGFFSLLELEVLLAQVLGQGREFLIAHPEYQLEEGDWQLLESYLSRLQGGESVAYITGSKEFYGLDFFVDRRVLVPRQETEMMIEEGVKFIDENKIRRPRILDIGTGSGNIAVSLVYALRERGLDPLMDAVDVSVEALEVASLNAEKHGVQDVVHFFESDLLEAFDPGQSYDLILANLPYIGRERFNFVEAKVRKHEPEVALFGGNDGLDLYRKLFRQLDEKKIGFQFLMGEYGSLQKEDLSDLLFRFFDQKDWEITFVADHAGNDRFFILKSAFA